MGESSPTRIFGYLTDRQGCGYYRIALPFRYLPSDLFMVGGGTGIDERWWDVADIVVGQRLATEANVGKWLRICADPSMRTAYDIDDDLWDLHPSNPAYGFYSQPSVQANVTKAIAAANLVTTSTQVLAERLREINPNVLVLPNCVDGDALTLPTPDTSLDVVTIGWAGTPTHAPDWATIAPAVRDVVATEPSARVAFLGTAYVQGLSRDRVSIIPWQTEIGQYYDHLRTTVDVGLAPIEDTPFNRAKSAIKAIEYSAAGIPVVASNVGPYADYVQHGVTGYLCDTLDDWGHYIRLLIKDRDLRIQMGTAAREHVRARTIQANIHRWVDAYQGLLR